jgi:dCMP deaminase
LIANAGLCRIVFGEFYRDERIFSFSDQLGIELVHLALANQASASSPEGAE